jgi:hypothetical protein
VFSGPNGAGFSHQEFHEYVRNMLHTKELAARMDSRLLVCLDWLHCNKVVQLQFVDVSTRGGVVCARRKLSQRHRRRRGEAQSGGDLAAYLD